MLISQETWQNLLRWSKSLKEICNKSRANTSVFALSHFNLQGLVTDLQGES